MGGLWTLEGIEFSRVKHMVINEMPSIIVAEWVLWVPTMFATFRFVAPKYQVLAINIVGVVWQTFLSLVASEAHGTHDSCEVVVPPKTKHKPKIIADVGIDAADLYDFFEYHSAQ